MSPMFANVLAAMLANELTPTTAARDVIRSRLVREPTGAFHEFKINKYKS